MRTCAGSVITAMYAGAAAGMGLSLALLWMYAVRRGFTARGLLLAPIYLFHRFREHALREDG